MAAVPLCVRALSELDRDAVATLYRESGQPSLPEVHWRWKFEPQSPGIHNRWLAFVESQAVLHYAGIPLSYRLEGAYVTGVVSVDTLTGRAHRRRGVLTEGAREVYRSWAAGGAAFVLGLPNQQWGSRTRALGWQPLFPMRWLTLPLRPCAWAVRRFGLPAVLARLDGAWRWPLRVRARPRSTLTLHEVTEADERFDTLWQDSQATRPFCAARDRRFVAWRFFGHPDHVYRVLIACRGGRPVGYAAWRRNGHAVLLADLFTGACDRQAGAALLNGVLTRALDSDAHVLLGLAVPGQAAYRLLRQRGFVPRRAGFSVELLPLAAGLPLASMHEAAHWHLAGADFDVV